MLAPNFAASTDRHSRYEVHPCLMVLVLLALSTPRVLAADGGDTYVTTHDHDSVTPPKTSGRSYWEEQIDKAMEILQWESSGGTVNTIKIPGEIRDLLNAFGARRQRDEIVNPFLTYHDSWVVERDDEYFMVRILATANAHDRAFLGDFCSTNFSLEDRLGGFRKNVIPLGELSYGDLYGFELFWRRNGVFVEMFDRRRKADRHETYVALATQIDAILEKANPCREDGEQTASPAIRVNNAVASQNNHRLLFNMSRPLNDHETLYCLVHTSSEKWALRKYDPDSTRLIEQDENTVAMSVAYTMGKVSDKDLLGIYAAVTNAETGDVLLRYFSPGPE